MMTIIIKVDDFMLELFPEVNINDKSSIIKSLEDFYSYGSYKPKVTIEDGWITIIIDSNKILNEERVFDRAMQLCEKGKFTEAKPIIEKLIENNPTVSEYYRNLGQIYSEEGDQEEAINFLIDALRWDPENEWALVMVGNIFAKYKDDIETAMKYYEKVITSNPKNNIALNNIGGNLLQLGRGEEAKLYFEKALEINDKYPNTHYALSMYYDMEGNYSKAFNSALNSLKLQKKSNDPLYQNTQTILSSTANRLIMTNVGSFIVEDFKNKVESISDYPIEVKQDDSIPTAAKVEMAENYNRDVHIIRFKSEFPAVDHLVMHELTHIDLAIKAREIKTNYLFITNRQHKELFLKSLESHFNKLNKKGFSDQMLTNYLDSLFSGMCQQIFNAPIDLVIEDYLYNEYHGLRGFQFISLHNLIQQGIDAVTGKQIVELTSPDIISKSKIYNLTYAFQFKDLYGIDLIDQYKADRKEFKTARKFYDSFLKMKENRKPGDEYKLVLDWAVNLKLNNFFELVEENSFRKNREEIDKFTDEFEVNPLLETANDINKERDTQKFLDSQKKIGTNMAVVMYMVDAMEHFKSKTKEELKEIAFEIATLGTQGIDPSKEGYRLHLVPDKKFSGYHLLAYYYVSWALAIPEMLDKLQLPYDEEFKLAKQIANK